MKTFKGYINGEFITTGETLQIENPKDNSIVGEVAAMKAEHIEEAFKTARNTFKSFRKTSEADRIK